MVTSHIIMLRHSFKKLDLFFKGASSLQEKYRMRADAQCQFM